MKKILPVILLLVGIGAGVGAGIVLKPEPIEVVEINPCGDGDHNADDDHSSEDNEMEEAGTEFVKLNNQFVVPIVAEGRIASMVVLSLSVEVEIGHKEEIYAREPKLRDGFLQVLFDHANMGGFNGAFTNSNNMDILRNALFETARNDIGDSVKSVLVMDIARQDN